jgi:hypothetical protein
LISTATFHAFKADDRRKKVKRLYTEREHKKLAGGIRSVFYTFLLWLHSESSFVSHAVRGCAKAQRVLSSHFTAVYSTTDHEKIGQAKERELFSFFV